MSADRQVLYSYASTRSRYLSRLRRAGAAVVHPSRYSVVCYLPATHTHHRYHRLCAEPALSLKTSGEVLC